MEFFRLNINLIFIKKKKRPCIFKLFLFNTFMWFTNNLLILDNFSEKKKPSTFIPKNLKLFPFFQVKA